MVDIRPVGYIIGWLLGVLGASMLFPMIADIVAGGARGQEFASTAIITVVAGAVMVLACQTAKSRSMNIQQSFLLEDSQSRSMLIQTQPPQVSTLTWLNPAHSSVSAPCQSSL